LTKEPPAGDTCLSLKGSGASPGSPSWGHVSLPDGLRSLAREPLPGTHFSSGRAPVARPGAPPGDTWLSRKGSGGLAPKPLRRTRVSLGKEKKRKGKSYYRRFLKITAGNSGTTTGGLRLEPPAVASFLYIVLAPRKWKIIFL